MKIPGIERGSTRPLSVENWLWKGLWSCRRSGCGMNEWTNEWVSEWHLCTLQVLLRAGPVILLRGGCKMSGILWRSWMHHLSFHMPSDQVHESCLIYFSPQVLRSLKTMCQMSDISNLTKMLTQRFGHIRYARDVPGSEHWSQTIYSEFIRGFPQSWQECIRLAPQIDCVVLY